jgi:hypothetical protein
MPANNDSRLAAWLRSLRPAGDRPERLEKTRIYDASYCGSPFDPTAPLVSITDGVQPKVCDIASCGYQFGNELKAIPDWYLKEVYRRECNGSGDHIECGNIPVFLRGVVKSAKVPDRTVDPVTKKPRYKTIKYADFRDFASMAGLPLDSSGFQALPANGSAPSWVGQVVSQRTGAANAIRTYVNKTGSAQIPKQLLNAMANCTMHP